MKILIVMSLAAFLLLPAVSIAGDACEVKMEALDQALDAKPDLDEETIVDEDNRKTVMDLRKKAEELHENGKHAEAQEMLDEGIELLSNEV